MPPEASTTTAASPSFGGAAKLMRASSYEGAGHNYLVAAGDAANADVLAFLAEVDGRVSVS